MPKPGPEETIAGSRDSGGCSIASSDSEDSAFDLFLMVLTVLIPVWWKIPLSESLQGLGFLGLKKSYKMKLCNKVQED